VANLSSFAVGSAPLFDLAMIEMLAKASVLQSHLSNDTVTIACDLCVCIGGQHWSSRICPMACQCSQ